jgi:protein-L-isoaspartate O-methyltransferase
MFWIAPTAATLAINGPTIGPGAPYDRTIVTASSANVPEACFDQLKERGLLVMPLRITDSLPFQQVVVSLQRVATRFAPTR